MAETSNGAESLSALTISSEAVACWASQSSGAGVCEDEELPAGLSGCIFVSLS
jgi:hypothetical protein